MYYRIKKFIINLNKFNITLKKNQREFSVVNGQQKNGNKKKSYKTMQ